MDRYFPVPNSSFTQKDSGISSTGNRTCLEKLLDFPIVGTAGQGISPVLRCPYWMRPTRIELATFGLKDRRSLDPVKGPLTTELRAPEAELYRRDPFGAWTSDRGSAS